MVRGEIWPINLDPVVGAELRKTRPAVIMSDDAIGILPLKVIVPVTDWKERYAIAPWMVRLDPDSENGPAKTSAADAFQVRSVAQDVFPDVSAWFRTISFARYHSLWPQC